MDSPSRAPRRLLLRRWVPYGILAIGLTVALAVTWYVMGTTEAREHLRLEASADETRHLLEIRLNTYIELLRAGASLFSASDDVTRRDFREFVRGLRLRERYPGIQGVGFAMRMPRGEIEAEGRRPDRLEVDEVRVWPPGDREEYTVILYLEPLDARNRAAIGYDMFTEPVRRAAMERARDTGEPAASGKVTLVQEIDAHKQAGFLIYVPVYRDNLPLETVEQRRHALVGYVYSPFRAADLLHGVFGPDNRAPLDFHVYDGPRAVPTALLHSSNDLLPYEDTWQTSRLVMVAGRHWTVQFVAPMGSGLPWLGIATLGGGLLLSLGLFGVTLAQQRAWEVAARRAAELRTSEEALRESESRLRRLVVLEREARAAAQAADRAKDEFLATLSHELRTPLNAMLGWITMLRAGKVRDERREDAIEVIERNARTQARLIEDLLDVSRIITGKVRVELRPMYIGPVARAVLDGLRPGAEAKGVRVHDVITPDLAPIMGDPGRVQQIIWNLLSNAVKFTPPGGDVHLELTGGPEHVLLRVRDTGVGISPEFLPHVFERFRQADSSTTRRHSGVGLGLAIVRHLVDLHGGAVEAQSEGRGYGATFGVRFPLAATAAFPATATTEASVMLSGLRVLVIDDDPDTREMLKESLEGAGARVAVVGSGRAALQQLQVWTTDVLVSDIGMPEMDGYALIRAVRDLPGALGRIPAIALTAYARPEDQEQAAEAGFQTHLPKPVELQALQAAIASLAAVAHSSESIHNG